MVILDHYGMIFDAVGVFGLAFRLLFKSWSSYCGCLSLYQVQVVNDKGSKGTHGCSSFMYFHYSRKERDFMTIPPLSPFSPAKSSALIQSFSCG